MVSSRTLTFTLLWYKVFIFFRLKIKVVDFDFKFEVHKDLTSVIQCHSSVFTKSCRSITLSSESKNTRTLQKLELKTLRPGWFFDVLSDQIVIKLMGSSQN